MTICLWFDSEAEEAAKFYTSIFKDSATGAISRYGKEGFEMHRQPEGKAMIVPFRLNKMEFMGLNAGPQFKFNESISIVVNCETQQEIDHYWNNLTQGGQESRCGWLKDKYGLSWQIVPNILAKLMSDPAKAGKVMDAFMPMKKLEIAKLLEAAAS